MFIYTVEAYLSYLSYVLLIEFRLRALYDPSCKFKYLFIYMFIRMATSYVIKSSAQFNMAPFEVVHNVIRADSAPLSK